RRLAACIADPGEYSLREELESRLPAFVARQLDDGGSRPIVWLLDRVLQRRLRQPTAGWGLRRGPGCTASRRRSSSYASWATTRSRAAPSASPVRLSSAPRSGTRSA